MGSNMLGFSRVGSRFDVGAMPMEPARAAAKSERMSACCIGDFLAVYSFERAQRVTLDDMGGT